jgi:AcrR family transcriptional regulator
MSDAAHDGRPERGYHHGDLRNALIRAGMTLLTTEGAAALDLRKVARLAGVSHAAPYRHFADKNALLIAIAQAGFEQLEQTLTDAARAQPDEFPARLIALGGAYLAFGLEHAALMRAMYHALTLDDDAQSPLHTAAKRCLGGVRAALSDAAARGYLQPEAVETHTSVLWAAIHGMIMLMLDGQMREARDDATARDGLVRAAVSSLWRGMID